MTPTHLRALALAGGLALAAASAAPAEEALSGEYGQSEAGQWFTILDFPGGDAVVLTMIGTEDRMEGTYSRKGDMVDLAVAGEKRALKLDGDGCLDGGLGNSLFAGRLCPRP